jgi:hypothetical protein
VTWFDGCRRAELVVHIGCTADTFYIQEPGAGAPVEISRGDLLSGNGSPAFGGWSDVYGVFLP